MNQAQQIAAALLDAEDLKAWLHRHPRSKPKFQLGQEVLVIPSGHDVFDQEFVGTICSFKRGWIQVADQEDNWFDCSPRQLKRLRAQ